MRTWEQVARDGLKVIEEQSRIISVLRLLLTGRRPDVLTDNATEVLMLQARVRELEDREYLRTWVLRVPDRTNSGVGK